MNNPHIGSTLDELLLETGELEEAWTLAKYKILISRDYVSDLDIERGRQAIEKEMERLERDFCSSRLGLLQGALNALADFSGVLDSEELFIVAARAAWKAKR